MYQDFVAYESKWEIVVIVWKIVNDSTSCYVTLIICQGIYRNTGTLLGM
jgi:hypothetical protein